MEAGGRSERGVRFARPLPRLVAPPARRLHLRVTRIFTVPLPRRTWAGQTIRDEHPMSSRPSRPVRSAGGTLLGSGDRLGSAALHDRSPESGLLGPWPRRLTGRIALVRTAWLTSPGSPIREIRVPFAMCADPFVSWRLRVCDGGAMRRCDASRLDHLLKPKPKPKPIARAVIA